jgi:5-methylcytosine-specific restriction protein A
MAQKKLHVCNKMGCNNLTRNRFCEQHEYIEIEERKAINRRYNQNRTDDKEQAFYKSKGWKIARKKALARDEYICQDCKRLGYIVPAVTVHHIIPIKEEWKLRLIIENMVSLCESCHQQRHRKLNEANVKQKMKNAKNEIFYNIINAIQSINSATEPPHQ